MRRRAFSLDDLDVQIIRTVVEQPGIGILDVIRLVDPTLPQNTARNRVIRLSNHDYLDTEKILNRVYVIRPGPRSAEVSA